MSDSSSAVSVAAGPRRLGLIGVIAFVVVVLDATTKAIAVQALAHRGLVSIFGGALHLELYRNHAGPGNMLAGHPVLVSLLSIGATLLMCGFAWSVRRTGYAVASGLLLGGAVGNMLDRFFGAPGPLRGGVIDWIKPTLHSGSMNLADLAINAGVLVMVLAAVVEFWGDTSTRRGGRSARGGRGGSAPARTEGRSGGGRLIGGEPE